MAILQIRHEDGREFMVAEAAFDDLYKPFGFKPVGVVYDGAVQPYNPENLQAAAEFEKAGGDPNQTYLTLEAASRQAADSGDTDSATDLAKQSVRLSKVALADVEPADTTPAPSTPTAPAKAPAVTKKA